MPTGTGRWRPTSPRTRSCRPCRAVSVGECCAGCLRPSTGDQHFDAHAQLAPRLEPRETRTHVLAHRAPVVGGKPQIRLRYRAHSGFDRLPVIREALETVFARHALDADV